MCILAGDLSVVGIRHGRIEPLAVAARAVGERVDELIVGPGADAGLRIGGDVRPDEQTERRFNVAAAGKLVTAARQRVTSGAIAGDHEIAAALDLPEILFVDALANSAAGDKRRAAQSRQQGRFATQ